MNTAVKEDRPGLLRRTGPGARGGVVNGFLGAVLIGLCAATPALAQGGGFEASVVDMSQNMRRVAIPLNKSVVVRTTVESAKVFAVAGDIASVDLISPTELLVTGKGYGSTNIVLTDARDKQYLLEVTVELDVAALNDALKSIDPQGSAQAKQVLGSIILTGTVSSADKAARAMEIANLFLAAGSEEDTGRSVQNHLDVAGEQQVLLRCIVAEVNRTSARELGINGFLAGENFRDGFLVNQIGGINPANIGAAADAPVTANVPFLTGADGIPLSPTVPLSLGFPRVQMQLFIQAMADNSLLKIMAEPNLVAISGETASFLAGGSFPIPVPQGLDSVTVEFREFGVRLNFTPVVRGNQKIRLRVAPEVSELDFSNSVSVQGFTVPGLSTRNAETTIELGAGQTIAIAGLLSESTRGIASRIPGIGDVPVLGALFRSVEYRRSQTELVILVTPEIVSPLEPHQIPPLPGEDILAPSDWELYGKAMLEGHADAAQAAPVETTGMGGRRTPRNPDLLTIHGPWGPEYGSGSMN
jgi:pilus assembly protein CpaC